MNHISTLTVTQRYIENRVRQLNQQSTDDILQVIVSMMASVDERFKQQEQTMKQTIDKVTQVITISNNIQEDESLAD